ELAGQLGIADRVRFTGALAQSEVFAILSLMDVVVMPSRPGLEGFGLAGAEAMAAGKPVIAPNVDALQEVVGEHDVAGQLIAPGDVPALARELDDLLDHAAE